MKRLITSLMIVLMLVSAAFAIEWTNKSAQTASAAITTTSGYLHGIMLATDGTNSVTISVYDNASAASGTTLIPTQVVTTSAANRSTAINISPAVIFYNGIYVEITCSGTVGYTVYYRN